MPDNLKYTFTKYSQPKYYDIGKERLQINREYVGIRVADDQDKIIFYEPDAGKEDFTNQHNLLAEVDSFVEKHLRQIKIDPELLPIEIRKSINYTKLFSRIDKKMEQHIQDIRNHEKLMTDFGHYYNLMQKMSKFTPQELLEAVDSIIYFNVEDIVPEYYLNNVIERSNGNAIKMSSLPNLTKIFFQQNIHKYH